MTQLPDLTDEIAARLMMFEFMLEVSMANQLAAVPPSRSAAAKRVLVEKMGQPRPDSVDDFLDNRRLQSIAARSVELAEHFVAKVSEREAEIRKTR
jgi:hypothetical protein